MNSSGPLVSVLIPSFNSEKYLCASVESCLKQSYTNLEIIIVDDGSDDSSYKLANQLAETDNRIKTFRQKNQGACSARNLAFSQSNGEFIQYLDADDLISANKIEDQIKHLDSSKLVVANGSWARFYTNNPITEDLQWGPNHQLRRDLSPFNWLKINHMSAVHCWLTPRVLIEQAGRWDESLTQNQDGEFFMRVLANADLIKYTPRAKAYYRSNISNSVSQNWYNKDKILSRLKSCYTYERVLLSKNSSSSTKMAIANKYQDFIYSAYPFQMESIRMAQERINALGGSNLGPYPSTGISKMTDSLFGWKVKAHLKRMKILFGAK